MYVALYLTLGVAFTGGLFWALAQITARQRRLNAELTRLERLSAEVSMSAEAILDRVDERMEQLNAMLAVVEQKAEARGDDSVVAPVTTPAAVPERQKRKRSRPRSNPLPTPDAPADAPVESVPTSPPPTSAVNEDASPAPPPLTRYQDLRIAVWALAGQDKTASDIAEELGVPRGEVQLMLNLRKRRVTA